MASGYVGVLGNPGTFSYRAALEMGMPLESLMPMSSLNHLITAIETKEVSIAVVPVENTTTGLIRPIVDGLLQSKCWIEEVYSLGIAHHLVQLKDPTPQLNTPLEGSSKLEALKQGDSQRRLYVQREAYDQCLEFLNQYPLRLRYTESSSDALEELLQQSPQTALAVVGDDLLNKYSDLLEVLASNIETNKFNKTRFAKLVNRQEKGHPTNGTLTNCTFTNWMFCVDLAHRPGALAELLVLLAEQRINILALHSRPLHNALGRYRFILEIESAIGVTLKYLENTIPPQVSQSIDFLGAWNI